MENVPIPDAPKTERATIADLAKKASEIGLKRYQLETAVQKRLATTLGVDARGTVIGKLNQKAEEWWEQSFPELEAAPKTSFKLKKNPFQNPQAANEWDPYVLDKKTAHEALTRQLADTEAEINDRVYRLFNLTKDEITLLQREVEH